ncbi:predicted protein [Uncinocarpus reesii 1704]|uniref:Uncharacterized protein n=1 Tax=Uncinocarpus reesii (strain UAMH 1704) TaxID=336963 RepID=C4JJ26_UNCRE|nr:uncharacterized protein UREG_01633 [Uncinocarpus reesii 1704]EEP76784.1 predicted protein [Uncinocarpus reesii 1704]
MSQKTEFLRATSQAGMDFDPFPRCAPRLRQVGFQSIEQTEKVVPIGTWPKDKKLKARGRYFMAQLLGNALETYSLSLFTRVAGWTPDEVYALLDDVAEEVAPLSLPAGRQSKRFVLFDIVLYFAFVLMRIRAFKLPSVEDVSSHYDYAL